MKIIMLLFTVCLITNIPFELSGQSHESIILDLRKASNEALKTQNLDDDLNFLTEDILITTGAGTLLCGKPALRDYIENANSNQPMFWVRSTSDIHVNEGGGLAWENGEWNGYMMNDLEEKNPVVGGRYAAMWTNASGEWKIKSQLFVTLK